jgi:hypothetical protein
VQDCHASWFIEVAIGFETRGAEKNIEGLPLTWFSANVDQGRVLPVDRTGLTVCIGWVVKGIQYLDFELALQKHAAVTTPLALSLDSGWSCPFDVQLNISEGLGAVGVSTATEWFHGTVFDDPLDWFPFRACPSVEA